LENREWGKGGLFPLAQTTSRGSVATEAGAVDAGRQREHSQLKAAPEHRLKSSGEAAAVGLKAMFWET